VLEGEGENITKGLREGIFHPRQKPGDKNSPACPPHPQRDLNFQTPSGGFLLVRPARLCMAHVRS
jgi:hypothetical protein